MSKQRAKGAALFAVVCVALLFATVASAQNPGKPPSTSQLDQDLEALTHMSIVAYPPDRGNGWMSTSAPRSRLP